MPKRTDIERILMLGAGPIVIGQACEFDYSGTQACKALREDGYQVVLLNSNPATIMTDPEIALRPHLRGADHAAGAGARSWRASGRTAVLTTLGGQTALNLAVSAAEAGMFERYGVEMLGADLAHHPARCRCWSRSWRASGHPRRADRRARLPGGA